MDSKKIKQYYGKTYKINKNHRIAIIGAGEIVNACHLPAYRQAGFEVAGIYSKPIRDSELTAARFGLPTVYRNLDEILTDAGVDVVDIAIPAIYQPDLAIKIARHGKHILCQKPLAPSFAQALNIVEAAKAAGVKLAVNQNGRWAPAVQAVHRFIRQGLLGTPTLAQIESSRGGLGRLGEWLSSSKYEIILYSAIHFLDAIRFLFGMPETVYAVGSHYPGQKEVGETLAMITCSFKDGLQAWIMDSHQNWTGEQILNYRFEGTKGVARGTLGEHIDYPNGGPDTLQFRSRTDAEWVCSVLEGSWFPGAFASTMGELLEAIEQDREPSHSGRDNLNTLSLVFAAYQSMSEKRAVDPREFLDT